MKTKMLESSHVPGSGREPADVDVHRCRDLDTLRGRRRELLGQRSVPIRRCVAGTGSGSGPRAAPGRSQQLAAKEVADPPEPRTLLDQPGQVYRRGTQAGTDYAIESATSTAFEHHSPIWM